MLNRIADTWFSPVLILGSSSVPLIVTTDLCTMQLNPLYHREEGIEEGSRNRYLCMV